MALRMSVMSTGIKI